MAEPRPSKEDEFRDRPGARKPARGGGESPQSALDSSSAVLEDLEALRARAAGLEQERDEFRTLLQRTRADFENYQKRIQREVTQEQRYWHGKLALDVLPILDNFVRAVAAAKQSGESGPLVQGVTMIQSQILDALRRHGITPIEAQGQQFDPNLHQAVMQQPSGDVPPNTVLQVLEQGFMIHDRVLRPASVIVSRAPEDQA
jgi:molecular chaperone GrpE